MNILEEALKILDGDFSSNDLFEEIKKVRANRYYHGWGNDASTVGCDWLSVIEDLCNTLIDGRQ